MLNSYQGIVPIGNENIFYEFESDGSREIMKCDLHYTGNKCKEESSYTGKIPIKNKNSFSEINICENHKMLAESIGIVLVKVKNSEVKVA